MDLQYQGQKTKFKFKVTTGGIAILVGGVTIGIILCNPALYMPLITWLSGITVESMIPLLQWLSTFVVALFGISVAPSQGSELAFSGCEY